MNIKADESKWSYKSKFFKFAFPLEEGFFNVASIKRINDDVIYEFYIRNDYIDLKPFVLIYSIEQNIFTLIQLNKRINALHTQPQLNDSLNIIRHTTKHVLCVGYSTKKNFNPERDCILEVYDIKSLNFLSRITLPGTFDIYNRLRIVPMTVINNRWIMYSAVPESLRKEIQIILIDPYNGLVETLRKVLITNIVDEGSDSFINSLEAIDRRNGNIEFIIKKDEYRATPTIIYCY